LIWGSSHIEIVDAGAVERGDAIQHDESDVFSAQHEWQLVKYGVVLSFDCIELNRIHDIQ
jgi:hypothetical protein